jgi:hypothetical protein
MNKAMTTPLHPFWRWMLRAAAGYNLIVAAAGFFAHDATVTGRIIAVLVACFGVVYALVSREPERLAPVLWAGVLGKLGVVVLLLPDVLAARAAPGTGWVLLGDGLFTALFLAFLASGARANQS